MTMVRCMLSLRLSAQVCLKDICLDSRNLLFSCKETFNFSVSIMFIVLIRTTDKHYTHTIAQWGKSMCQRHLWWSFFFFRSTHRNIFFPHRRVISRSLLSIALPAIFPMQGTWHIILLHALWPVFSVPPCSLYIILDNIMMPTWF